MFLRASKSPTRENAKGRLFYDSDGVKIIFSDIDFGIYWAAFLSHGLAHLSRSPFGSVLIISSSRHVALTERLCVKNFMRETLYIRRGRFWPSSKDDLEERKTSSVCHCHCRFSRHLHLSLLKAETDKVRWRALILESWASPKKGSTTLAINFRRWLTRFERSIVDLKGELSNPIRPTMTVLDCERPRPAPIKARVDALFRPNYLSRGWQFHYLAWEKFQDDEARFLSLCEISTRNKAKRFRPKASFFAWLETFKREDGT